ARNNRGTPAIIAAPPPMIPSDIRSRRVKSMIPPGGYVSIKGKQHASKRRSRVSSRFLGAVLVANDVSSSCSKCGRNASQTVWFQNRRDIWSSGGAKGGSIHFQTILSGC